MRLIELAGSAAVLAPPLDDRLAVFREPDDFRLALAVAERDDDLAVRRDDDVVRLEAAVRFEGAAWFSERHQQLAVRAELEDLMAERGAGSGSSATASACLRPRRATRWRRAAGCRRTAARRGATARCRAAACAA